MKHLLLFTTCLCASTVSAQVVMDKPVQFTGPDDVRTVQGMDAPTEATSLISVGTWVNGEANWALATYVGTTIQLTTPPATPAQPGSLLRFTAPGTFFGVVLIQLDGASAQPLVRPDGLPPVLGQVITGMVNEVLFLGDRFVLMNSASRGCPPATLQVNERFCIDINQGPLLGMYESVDRCALRGGKLCRWDEYYHACTVLGTQLQGMFNDWEWIDDTANHTHLACQAGRTTCMSQRTASALTELTSTHCCYQLP
ncbi:MAG: hypothetical protein ABI432_12515 [Flavobacteriales bacterium]